MAQQLHIAHVLVPLSVEGDPATNVVRNLVREHTAAGGRSSVVLAHDRPLEVPGAVLVKVDYSRYCSKQWFSRRELRTDFAFGIMGLQRPYTSRLPIPAMQALATLVPDIIIIHEAHYASSGLRRWRAQLPNTKIVLYLHASVSRSYLPWEMGKLIGAADHVVGVSRHMIDSFRLRYPLLKTPLHAVLNGTNPRSVARLRQGESPIRLLFVGRVVPDKGPHLLIDAAVELLRAGVPVSLRIVGSAGHGSVVLTPFEEDLRRRALGFENAISFIPYLAPKEVQAEYARADILCAPSVFADPCPLVVLEGLASGIAIIASRQGGIPEIGADAISYFDVAKPDSLVHALTAAMRPYALVELQAKSRSRAQELTWAKQYAHLISEISPN